MSLLPPLSPPLEVRFRIPKPFTFLMEPAPFKALHGGRGSAKSHSVAAALVEIASRNKKLIGCFRETQTSIRDSVKKLLENKINEGGYRRIFRSTDNEIRCISTGSLFIFKGLRGNVESVKSTEAVDIGWIEEAQSVTQNSLDTFLPTMHRVNDSEIWATWNPNTPDDPVDAMFRGNDQKTKDSGFKFRPPPGAVVQEFNYDQNPFFPEGLRLQMEWDQERDPDKYAHVWRGKYKTRSEARVFKNWRVEAFNEPPKDTIFHYGADWGFSIDPSVLTRCFIDEEARKLYVDQEAYAVGCDIEDLPKLFAGKHGATPDELKTWSYLMDAAWPGVPDARRWQITADSARPETIAYMRKHGFNMVPAKKGPGSVIEGVEFLQNYDIIVHPRCKHTIDELSFYSFKTDPLTNKVLPILADKKNHVIDALRYAVEGMIQNPGAIWAKLGKQIVAERAKNAEAQAARAKALQAQGARR